jgi:hypothetical protein
MTSVLTLPSFRLHKGEWPFPLESLACLFQFASPKPFQAHDQIIPSIVAKSVTTLSRRRHWFANPVGTAGNISELHAEQFSSIFESLYFARIF